MGESGQGQMRPTHVWPPAIEDTKTNNIVSSSSTTVFLPQNNVKQATSNAKSTSSSTLPSVRQAHQRRQLRPQLQAQRPALSFGRSRSRTCRKSCGTYIDRLAGFGIVLLERTCRKNGTTLDVASHDESSTADRTQELAEDLLAVCNYFEWSCQTCWAWGYNWRKDWRAGELDKISSLHDFESWEHSSTKNSMAAGNRTIFVMTRGKMLWQPWRDAGRRYVMAQWTS